MGGGEGAGRSVIEGKEQALKSWRTTRQIPARAAHSVTEGVEKNQKCGCVF
jgi:hypothetical protein